jgi:hypothetical protein
MTCCCSWPEAVKADPADSLASCGHSDILTTQQVYQHDDMTSRADALSKVEQLYSQVVDGGHGRSRQISRQELEFLDNYWYARRDSNSRPLVPEFIHGQFLPIAEGRVQSVKRVMAAYTRAWLVGAVAVTLAVNSPTAREAV